MVSAARANRRLALRLLMVTAAMFGFGYALVPLYDIVCDITGIGGRTGVVSEATAATGGVDSTRVVTVQFVATVNSGLRWAFDGPEKPLEVHPGKVYEANFLASNLSPRPVIAQAVPSVYPGRRRGALQQDRMLLLYPAAPRARRDPHDAGALRGERGRSRAVSAP